MHFRYIFSVIFTFIFTAGLFSQNKIDTKNEDLKAGFLNLFSYSYDFSGGDLNNRFGNNFHFGIAPSFYFKDSNWSIGTNFDFIFGYNVKENTFSNLITFDEQILTTELYLSTLATSERGYVAGVFVSKILPLNIKSKRTGIRLDFGVNYMSTWIRFKDESGTIPQLEQPYVRGYDNMTNGLAFREYIGYQYIKTDSKANFNIGIELIQGLTKNIRGYNYESNTANNSKSLDLLFGLKFGWFLPIYIEDTPEEVYY
ncbi:MAG: hypothetical protein R2771_10815 [Saprospiraceae bacterium]